MNFIETNIIKLIRAALGDVEFTDSIHNRITQLIHIQKQRALNEQLLLFEITNMPARPYLASADVEGDNAALGEFYASLFGWESPVRAETISFEQQTEELPAAQLLLPGFEVHNYTTMNGSI